MFEVTLGILFSSRERPSDVVQKVGITVSDHYGYTCGTHADLISSAPNPTMVHFSPSLQYMATVTQVRIFHPHALGI